MEAPLVAQLMYIGDEAVLYDLFVRALPRSLCYGDEDPVFVDFIRVPCLVTASIGLVDSALPLMASFTYVDDAAAVTGLLINALPPSLCHSAVVTSLF